MSRSYLAPYNPEPVQRLLAQSAERWPDETAIVDGERRFTFAELDAYSGRFASALATMGLGKGSIVGILAPNCAEFEIAFFGILKAGATVTTINSATANARSRSSCRRPARRRSSSITRWRARQTSHSPARNRLRNASSSRKGRMSRRRSAYGLAPVTTLLT